MHYWLFTPISSATLRYIGNKSVVKQINGLFFVESNINFFVFFGILRRTICSETGTLSIVSNNINL